MAQRCVPNNEDSTLCHPSINNAARPGEIMMSTVTVVGQSVVIASSHPFGKVQKTPVILCVHGTGTATSWKIWECLFAPLAAHGYHVIAFDMPGYGSSSGSRALSHTQPVSVVFNVLKALGISWVAALIGRSMGATIALSCASQQKTWGIPILALVLCHPSPPSPLSLLENVKHPVLLSWAKDEQGGQLFSGPHGASFFIKKLTRCICDLLVWNHSDYTVGEDPWKREQLFYSVLFVERVVSFLERYIGKKNSENMLKKSLATKKNKITFSEPTEVEKLPTLLTDDIPEEDIISPVCLKRETQKLIQVSYETPEQRTDMPRQTKTEDIEKSVTSTKKEKSQSKPFAPNREYEKKSFQGTRLRSRSPPSKADRLKTKSDQAFEAMVALAEADEEVEHLSLTLKSTSVTVHVAARGPLEGPAIVALHGDAGSWHAWYPILDPLSRAGFRVYCLDYPGYGRSPGTRWMFRDGNMAVAILKDVLDTLKISSLSCLVGRSVGGKTAFLFTSTHKNRVQRLVVTHPVIPDSKTLSSIRLPVLLTWAKDDTLGHPYSGPHGAAYVVQVCSAELISWTESAYDGNTPLFYSTVFAERLIEFCKRNKT